MSKRMYEYLESGSPKKEAGELKALKFATIITLLVVAAIILFVVYYL